MDYQKTVFWDLLNGYVAHKKGELKNCEKEEIECEKRNKLVLVLLRPEFKPKMKEITGYMSSPNKDDLITPVTRLRMKIEQVKYKYGPELYENFELIKTYIDEFLEIIDGKSMKSMPLLKY